jgi:hypothetical protein
MATTVDSFSSRRTAFKSPGVLRCTAAGLWRRFKKYLVSRAAHPLPKALVVVEGQNDVEFLRRMSAILHADDPSLPDLAEMERRRELLFMPLGGGDGRTRAFRFAGLGIAEFHLADRDVPPVTESRQQAADIVNWRPNCRAYLTSKRAMENYLESDAIFEAIGIRVEFSDDDDVADLVARWAYERHEGHLSWEKLPGRTRKRRRDKVKPLLNTAAVERMTPERLAHRDPDGEVRSWLTTILHLANGAP